MELLATFRDWIDDDSKRWKLYAVLSGLAMIRLWVIPLSCSLWLDETITYWSAYKGVGASLIRSQFWPGQNLAYSLLVATVIRLGGTSEIALRLPSVFAAIATTWLLYLLAKRMFDKETGFLAALVFVSSEQMTQTAPNARPYAIALLLVVASTLQLLRWLENERSLDMLGYVALAASVLYFHLLFGSLYLIHGIYVLASHASGSPARRRQPIIAALLLALLIAPIVWNTVFVKRPSTASSYQGTPDAARLLTAFLPATLGSSLFVALLVGLLFRQDHFSSVSRMPNATTVLLTSWLTIPIVVDFLVARFTGFKIFLPRY
jgi:mannosyltransferase